MLTPKGEASKNKLIASAEELFAMQGFHATTISQIVAHAGMTQAAFYLYFKSKDALLEEMLEKFEQQLLGYTDQGRHVNQLPKGEIKTYVIQAFTNLFKLLGQNVNLTRIALQETEKSEQIRGVIVGQIARNMKNNQLLGIVSTDIEPELFAEAMVASIERLIYRYYFTGEKSAEELGRQAGRLFLDGILNSK